MSKFHGLEGKKELTKAYRQFLANWARKLSWKGAASTFNTSWEKVFHAVEYMVEWGKAQRSLDNIKAIGVDEVAYHLGHKYLTVVYQIDRSCTRLLWVGQDRTEATIRNFFFFFGLERSQQLRYVCSNRRRT
ncbi:transposase [Endozoicomonas sp. 8E]|uniref:transposase n=1 Tax=Endozoicomonas sp. 8E TaxID=3035692 RepID=UPI003977DF38